LDKAEIRFFETLQTMMARTLDSSRFPKSKREHPRIVCGADAAYSGNNVAAVASAIDTRNGNILEQSEYHGFATFPYIPGLFFLREGPFVTAAVANLSISPISFALTPTAGLIQEGAAWQLCAGLFWGSPA
jgi:deoxyinosine 3'endonuclease (endonuclease V)